MSALPGHFSNPSIPSPFFALRYLSLRPQATPSTMSSLPSSHFPNFIRTDFWFNDGNIVLVAQNAAFKVHKGQLARHSEVFSDLFSLPQPSLHTRPSRSSGDWDERERDSYLIDGCPFVELQDSPSDLFYFLSALYDGLYFSPSNVHFRPHPPSFPSLSAVLRLSTKYLVEPLVYRCLFHLHLDWPTSLSAWDEREARFTLDLPSSSSPTHSPKNVGRGHANGRYTPREFCPHPILIIQFAQEMNLPEILPAAMYDLSRYGPSKIMNGTTTSSTKFDRLVAQLSNSHDWEAPKSVRLSRELLYQTLRGREETQRFLASFLEKELFSRPPSPSCHNIPPTPPSTPTASPTQPNPPTAVSIPPTSAPSPTPHVIQTQPNPCSDSFYFILLNILRSVGGVSFGRDADALFTLTQATEMLDRTDFYVAGSTNAGSSDGGGSQKTFGLNICQACKLEFREKVKRAREEMWSYLPRWFGLVGSETKEGEVVRM